jgi:hypothetical protein
LFVLFPLLLAPALAVSQVAVDSLYYAEPNPIPANSYGATVQIIGSYPTTPRGICFYTGYGSTMPLTGTAGTYYGTPTYIISVPATTIQQIPPTSFSSGTFQAKIYLVANTTTACNGTPNTNYSNQITVEIQTPSLTSVDITTLPQHNVNLSGVSAPTELYAHGSGFAGAPGGTAVFTYGTNQIVPQVTYNSSSSLGIAAPIVPAGVTSLTLEICNNGPTYNFCTSPSAFSVKALETNNGTLAVTLNSQGTYDLLATFGASAGDTAGIPVGAISFADGSANLGSMPSSVTQQTLVPAAVKGTWYSSGDGALTSYVADFDKDGLPDVLVFDTSTPTVLHLMLGANNRGDLNSDATISLGNSSGCYSFSGLAVADFNGDGYPDIAVVCPAQDYYSSVYVFINNGDGTFTSSYFQPQSAGTTITAADINKDGKPDIILGGPLSISGLQYGFTVLFGDGTGNFTTSSQFATTVNGFTNLLAGDLNNDGYPDLVVSTGGSNSYIYVFQNAAGTFGGTPTASLFTGGNTPAQVFLQTVAGINYPNLIYTVTGSTGTGFYGTENTRSSSAGFYPGFYFYSVPGLRSATLGDFNDDGTQDIATFNGTQIGIFFRETNGVFSQPGGTPNFTYAASGIALAGSGDFNTDGYPDLLTVTNGLQGNDFAESYINSGTVSATLSNVSFGVGPHPLTATSPGTVAYAPGTASYNLVVAPPPVSASLSVIPTSPAVYSPTTVETLTATITGASAAAGGTVVFMDGSLNLGSMSTTVVNSGTSTASLPVSLSAGTHSLSITFTGNTGSNASSITQSYVVQMGTPVLSWTPNPSTISYGTHLSGAQLDATATLNGVTIPGVFTYTPALGSLPQAGANQTLRVSFVPNDTIDYNSPIIATTTITVTKATPQISWPAPAGITYGTTLSGTQLNAQAYSQGSEGTLPGVYSYSPAAGALLSAGTQPLSVTFTPTDSTDYNAATASNSIVVAQATPMLSWPGPAAISAGTPLSSTQLDASATGVGGANLPGTFTYNPPAGTVLPPGSTQLNVSFVPADATDYTNASAFVTQVVNSNATRTTLTSSANPSIYGQSINLMVTVSSTTGTGTPTGMVNFLDGSTPLGSGTLSGGATSLPVKLNAGSHSLTATYQGDINFTGSTSSPYPETVAQATPSINWPTPAAIVYGTALSGAQLDATATNSAGVAVPGTFVYSPAAGAILGAGTQRLSVAFQPTDAVNYAAASGQAVLAVTQATPIIVWPLPASIVAGTPLSGTQLDATALGIGGLILPGTFTYTPAAGTVLSVGNTMLNVAFAPSDAVDYKSASGSVPLAVGLANTSTALASSLNPSSFGQSITLTATVTSNYTGASITGSVNFLDGQSSLGNIPLTNGVASISTAALTAGPHVLTAAYTGNTSFGISTSGPLNQNVSAGTATLTFPQPAAIVYGTPLSATQLNATLTPPNGVAEPGTLTYTPAAGTILGAGTQTLSVTFTPSDSVNFKAVTASTTIVVNKATPTIAWPTPASVVAGTILSTTQLNAVASGIAGPLPGTYTYNPTAGTVLKAGQTTLSLTFAPNDTTDYNTATSSVVLNVIGVTLTSLSNPTALLGDPATTITLTGTGFVTNSVVSVDGSAVTTTFVNGTTLTAVVPASVFATVHTAVVLVNDPTQGQTTNSLTIAISPAPLAATISGPTTTTVGAQPTVTFNLTNPYPVPLTATFTLTFTPASGLPVDPTVLFANGTSTDTIVVPAGSALTSPILFQSGSVAGTITVTSTFSAGGVTIVPTGGAQTLTIAAPPAVPGITSITLTRTDTVLTVTLHGYANTRTIDHVNFHFTASPGNTLSTQDITVQGAALFAPYYASAISQAYGSTFTYTQDFNLDASAEVVGQVQVTLVNSVGSSISVTAQ